MEKKLTGAGHLRDYTAEDVEGTLEELMERLRRPKGNDCKSEKKDRKARGDGPGCP
jgi:hypothetical protein